MRPGEETLPSSDTSESESGFESCRTLTSCTPPLPLRDTRAKRAVRLERRGDGVLLAWGGPRKLGVTAQTPRWRPSRGQQGEDTARAGGPSQHGPLLQEAHGQWSPESSSVRPNDAHGTRAAQDASSGGTQDPREQERKGEAWGQKVPPPAASVSLGSCRASPIFSPLGWGPPGWDRRAPLLTNDGAGRGTVHGGIFVSLVEGTH